MPAYLIAQFDISDMDRYQDYARLAGPVLKEYGGRFLARGGETVALEGPAPRQRNVIIEFADLDTATRYYHSEGYQAAKAKRLGAAEAQFFVVDGEAPA